MKERIWITVVILALLMSLAWLCFAASKPRIMVIVPEYQAGRAIPDLAGETEIIKKLSEHGFTVVEQERVTKIRQEQKEMKRLGGDAKAAAELGSK